MCWFGSCCDYHFFFVHSAKLWSGVVDFWRLFDLWCKQYSIKLIESEWLHEANGLYIKGDDAQCSLKIVTDTRTHIFFWNVFLMQTKNASYDWHHSKCVDIILNELVHLVRPQLHTRKRRKIQTLTKWKWKFPRKMFWWKFFSLSDAIVTVKTKLKE